MYLCCKELSYEPLKYNKINSVSASNTECPLTSTAGVSGSGTMEGTGPPSVKCKFQHIASIQGKIKDKKPHFLLLPVVFFLSTFWLKHSGVDLRIFFTSGKF